MENKRRPRASPKFKRWKKVGTTQRVSSLETTNLEDAPKQGRNDDKVSGEDVHNVDTGVDATNVGDDMDVDSRENADCFVVVDKEGNEVVMESVTQEHVAENLKTLEPEQLAKTSKFMAETVEILGEDAAAKVVEEVAKVDSATGDLISAASASFDVVASSKDSAAGLQVPTTSANVPTTSTKFPATKSENVSTAGLLEDDVSTAETMILLKTSKAKEADKQQQQSSLPT